MRRVTWLVTIVLLALATAFLLWLRHFGPLPFWAGLAVRVFAVVALLRWIAPTIAGYGAKVAASCIFVGGRTEASVHGGELDYPLLSLVATTVDRDGGSVVGSFLGMGRATARYRDGWGCTLSPGRAPDPPSPMPPAPVPGPSTPWPERALPADVQARVDGALDRAFAEPSWCIERNTRAVVVIHDGALVAERYGAGFGPDSRQAGWSMAKSVTGTLLGMLVQDGVLGLHDRLDVPEWQVDPQDPRRDLTLDQLMRMSSGLRWNENTLIDSTTMLFGRRDAGAYGADRPPAHRPDEVYAYSSGTTNVLSRMLRRLLGDEAYWRLPRVRLFDPLGMASAVFEVDATGTFVGSSFVWATARDWARLGWLYCDDGVWQGVRLVAPEWVDYVRTPTPTDGEGRYGAHFWVKANDEPARLTPTASYASGVEGQNIGIFPERRLVIVRLGQSGPMVYDARPFFEDMLGALEPLFWRDLACRGTVRILPVKSGAQRSGGPSWRSSCVCSSRSVC